MPRPNCRLRRLLAYRLGWSIHLALSAEFSAIPLFGELVGSILLHELHRSAHHGAQGGGVFVAKEVGVLPSLFAFAFERPRERKRPKVFAAVLLSRPERDSHGSFPKSFAW